MYLWTKNRLDMRLKLKAYGKFGGFVHFLDEKLNINGFTVEQIASQLPYRHMLNVWHKSSFKGTGVILYL